MKRSRGFGVRYHKYFREQILYHLRRQYLFQEGGSSTPAGDGNRPLCGSCSAFEERHR